MTDPSGTSDSHRETRARTRGDQPHAYPALASCPRCEWTSDDPQQRCPLHGRTHGYWHMLRGESEGITLTALFGPTNIAGGEEFIRVVAPEDNPRWPLRYTPDNGRWHLDPVASWDHEPTDDERRAVGWDDDDWDDPEGDDFD
jgi:hypothetical protein